MKKINIKSIKEIEVKALTWFDKTYGNTYFAGKIYVKYKNGKTAKFLMPFEYGYGEQYLYEALKILKKNYSGFEKISALWKVREKGISLFYSEKSALKKELKNIK